MDPAALGMAAVHASITQNAFVILTKCLMNNGALKPGQFSSAIKAKLNEVENRRSLDYQYLSNSRQCSMRVSFANRTSNPVCPESRYRGKAEVHYSRLRFFRTHQN